MSLWAAKRRIERDYQRVLIRLFQQTLLLFRGKDVERFPELMEGWVNTDVFHAYATALSRKMITGLFEDVGRSWREAARINGQGKKIYYALMQGSTAQRKAAVEQMIRENAALIRTLPVTTANEVTQYVMRETAAGRRPEAIEVDIRQLFPHRTKARAKLIARTETAKTQTALIQSDCQEIGVNWYFWRCVRDERSRDAHAKMEGVLCNWNDPPCPEALFPGYQKPYGRYPPGGTFNCRCHPEPLIIADQLPGTVKVHQGGQLVRMSKAAVIKLTGV